METIYIKCEPECTIDDSTNDLFPEEDVKVRLNVF